MPEEAFQQVFFFLNVVQSGLGSMNLVSFLGFHFSIFHFSFSIFHFSFFNFHFSFSFRNATSHCLSLPTIPSVRDSGRSLYTTWMATFRTLKASQPAIRPCRASKHRVGPKAKEDKTDSQKASLISRGT